VKDLDFLNAINELTGGVGFKIVETDLQTLQIADGSTNPTLEQIETKMAEMINEKAELKATKAAEKAALLQQLGITDEQAKLLLS